MKKKILCIIFILTLCLSGCFYENDEEEPEAAEEVKDYISEADLQTGYSELLDTVTAYYDDDGKVDITVYVKYAYAIPYIAEEYNEIVQEAITELEFIFSELNISYYSEGEMSAQWITEDFTVGNFSDVEADIYKGQWSVEDLYEYYEDYEEQISEIITDAGGSIADEYRERYGTLLDDFQGEWSSGSEYSYVIIDENEINYIHQYELSSKEYINVYTQSIDIDDDGNIIIVNSSGDTLGTLSLNEEGQLIETDSDGEETIYDFVSSNTEVPEAKTEPEIGMTEEEVLASTWGEPDEEKTTNNGTGVKWIYDTGYICFQNGIAIEISEY